MSDIITLAHGSGGRLTHDLIKSLFYRNFKNEYLLAGGDSGLFDSREGKMAFTTDSYVVTPLFFPGGDIGRLAVCGTVNDLSVAGAVPLYLSCGFIIEEGFRLDQLEKIVQSMAEAAHEAQVKIITGDTKVVQKGACDGLFINTSGVGTVPEYAYITPERIQTGDVVIVSGTIGDHGTAILLERGNFPIKSSVESDCAPLSNMLNELLVNLKKDVRVMRDPTRGGVATTLNELSQGNSFGIKLFEDFIPVRDEVRGVCEMLGLEPLYMANEGKVLAIVSRDKAQEALDILKKSKYGGNAAIIGEITSEYSGKVYMETLLGGSRIIDMLTGDQLPRIC